MHKYSPPHKSRFYVTDLGRIARNIDVVETKLYTS